MSFLYPFLIPLVSIVLQSYPRIINKYFGVDVWTRMLEIDHVRRNRHQIPSRRIAGQFMIPGYFDYPPLFPILLSYISKERLLAIQGYIAPIIDSIVVLLVYAVTYKLTGTMSLALLAQALYVATPLIAIENSNLTPRSFGYLFFYLSLLPLIFYVTEGTIEWFIIGTSVTAFLFLAHRFAIQAFFFISIFFTFALNSPVFLQSTIIAFLIALYLSKGYYLRVLQGHASNIYFWVLNKEHRWSHQIRGPQTKTKGSDWVALVYKLMSAFPPIAFSSMNPWSLSAFIALAGVYFGYVTLSYIEYIFALWIIFFYVLGAIVMKSKHLMPIGEGYRYMEMAALPSALLSVMLYMRMLDTPYRTTTLTGIIILGVLCILIILAIQIKGILYDRNRSVTKELFDVFSYINGLKKTPSIVCIPHQNTTMTIFHTSARVLVNADNPGLMRVQDIYPILKLPLPALAKKYKLTHALIKESFVTLRELGLTRKQIVYRSGDVILVKI